MNIKKILVPIDFSECSKDAYEYALNLADEFSSTLYILNVIEPQILDTLSHFTKEARKRIEERVLKKTEDDFDEFLKNSRPNKKAKIERLISQGIPFIEIIKKAKEVEADLISMGSYGRTGQLEQILFGSTAEKVVRGAPCPVVCVPRIKCIPERSGR